LAALEKLLGGFSDVRFDHYLRKEDGEMHRFVLVIVPLRDRALVYMALDSVGFAYTSDAMSSDDGSQKIENFHQITFSKAPFSDPVIKAIELCEAKQFPQCLSHVDGLPMTFNFSLMFCSFLSIRLRLMAKFEKRTEATRLLYKDIQMYAKVHFYHNGAESEQYGNALLLWSIFLRYWEAPDHAREKVMKALPLVTQSKGYAYFLLARLTKDNKQAFEYLKQTDVYRFYGIARVYYEKSQKMGQANYFARRSVEADPSSQEKRVLWAKIQWKLGNHRAARAIMIPHWDESVLKALNDNNDIHLNVERVCSHCEKIGSTMANCPVCHKEWYCSDECMRAHEPVHRPFCVWCHHCKNPCGKRAWCTGCFEAVYCGPDCQSKHWYATTTEGGHRKVCGEKNKK
jgi:hypothetical protein